jgi:hypothetical protein
MHPRAHVNPFEIALWILSAALLVAGVAGSLWASGVMNKGFSCSGADCTAPDDYALAQGLYMLCPPMVTAGLIAAVLSIALRAGLVGIARRTAVPNAPVPDALVAVPAEQQEQPQQQAGGTVGPGTASMTDARYPDEGAPGRVDPAPFAPPQFRQRRRAPDHSAFQRPSADELSGRRRDS